MALGAVTAAALTDHSAHYAMLTVGGVDLLLQPAAGASAGARYGVDIETIIATERGPNQVSVMEFILDDPLSQVSLSRNMPVLFTKTAETYPVFQGFVTSWAPEHSNGNLGRRTRVRCSGLEIVLDWAKLPAMSWSPPNLAGNDVFLSMVANVVDGLAFPIYAAINPIFDGLQQSTLQYPCVWFNNGLTVPITITAGTTLREGLRVLSDANTTSVGVAAFLFTVDSGGRLRGQISQSTVPNDKAGPADWAEYYVIANDATEANGNGSAGHSAVAQDFKYEVDATTPVAVYVIGNGATAVVGDITGDVGECAVISDSTLTTVAQCVAAGTGYLSSNQIQARGAFTLDSRTPDSTVRAGGTIRIADVVMGLTQSDHWRVMELERTFHGSLEDWKITFGGGGTASGVALLRRLTRSTLS